MEVCVEYRPRLQIANVAIFNIDEDEAVDFEHTLNARIADGCLVVNSRLFTCPEVVFLEGTLALTSLQPRSASFRVRAVPGGSGGDKSVAQSRLHSVDLIKSAAPPTGARTSKKSPPPPSLVPGRTYLLTCRACGTKLGRLPVGRVLPAPSAGWRHGATDWFCCVNRLERAPDLALRQTDLLYGPATCCLHRAAFKSLSVAGSSSRSSDEMQSDGEQLQQEPLQKQQQHMVWSCPACDAEIGTLDQEAVECWYAALAFHLRQEEDNDREEERVGADPWEKGCLTADPLQQASFLDNDDDNAGDFIMAGAAPTVHPAGASWRHNFLAYLAARVDETPEPMPRLTLQPRGDDCDTFSSLHLWIVDRQLTILRSGCGGGDRLAVQTVAKVLFKKSRVGSGLSCVSSDPPVEVADKMFWAGVSLLEDSCRNFPESVRTFQDYQVAFLPLL